MTPFERKLDRWLPRIMTASVLLALLTMMGSFAWTLVHAGLPFRTKPQDIVFADAAAAVRDARALVATRSECEIEPGGLPKSLRIAGLRNAYVHDGHVDLVLARSPDAVLGVRIWSAGQTPHDEPTRYRDIYLYRFDKDAPRSLDNMP